MIQEKLINLIIGSLLHDVGKVIYRISDHRKHSISGTEFLKNEAKISDDEILNCVRYHHSTELSKAKIEENDNAYITYIADNIASANDRRANGERFGFSVTQPLESVFNILNGNHQKYTYLPKMLEVEQGINYPQESKREFDKQFYEEVAGKIKENIEKREFNSENINSLLEVLEETCSYVPSSTNRSELSDISLYDHVKMTAAIATCIYHYLEYNHISNYKEVLFKNAKEFYAKDIFCMYSMDISGIQDFIYTIASKDALKTLRSRSFYIEIMMQHILDELCDKLEISRANIIYNGGGQCYILVPNTDKCIKEIERYEEEINGWLKKHFSTALYIGGGICKCNSNNLKNIPEGSYSDIYRTLSNEISNKKMCRYSAKDIKAFNSIQYDSYERECVVCKRLGNVNKLGECHYCEGIKKMSKDILYAKFFVVTDDRNIGYLELPGDKYLSAYSDEKDIKEIIDRKDFIRVYSSNKMNNGYGIAKNLWIGNYKVDEMSTFDEYEKASYGAKRLAVYRADVDDLGITFINGFKQNNGKYETLSRTATLSRQLTLFFKQHINYILSNPEYSLVANRRPTRNISIVYSGGDDIFVVGAWNDVMEFAVDLENAFMKFTQNTLSLSGGIGLYKSGYPINSMAEEVEYLESTAKNIDRVREFNADVKEKDAICLFEKILAYKWQEFRDVVLGEKYGIIYDFFDNNADYGKNFLYNLLQFIRSIDDNTRKNSGSKSDEDTSDNQINLARYVYILARMEPEDDAEAMARYRIFSEKMYKWIKSKKDRLEVMAAIYIYVYIKRQED